MRVAVSSGAAGVLISCMTLSKVEKEKYMNLKS